MSIKGEIIEICRLLH